MGLWHLDLFSVWSGTVQWEDSACHWGYAIFWKTVLVNALADVSHSAWSELSGLWCWGISVIFKGPFWWTALDAPKFRLLANGLFQYECESVWCVLNLWDLQLHRFMSTNGTLSALGVQKFFMQFSLKQKLVFDVINLVQDTGSGPVKQVVLIPVCISVLPFLSWSVC